MKKIKYIHVPESEDIIECWYIKLSNKVYWMVLPMKVLNNKEINFQAYFTKTRPNKNGRDIPLFDTVKVFSFHKFPDDITIEALNLYLLSSQEHNERAPK